MTLPTTKRTSAAAIRDVLERADALGDAPAQPSLSTRVRRRLPRTARRRSVGTHRSLLAVAALALTSPAVLADDASAGEFRPAWASFYGPGLWGNALGCGGTLQQGTIGVAHKTMRCGQRVRVCVRRCATARVIDRGPYVAGREFDLTAALAARVGFGGVGRIFVRTQG